MTIPRPKSTSSGSTITLWILDAGNSGVATHELNAHSIGERMKLILTRHQVAAIGANPELIVQAHAENDRPLAGHRATIGNSGWRLLLRRSVDEIIAYMLQKSPTGAMLRSSNPFSIILPPEPEAERRWMWRQAKAELHAEYQT